MLRASASCGTGCWDLPGPERICKNARFPAGCDPLRGVNQQDVSNGCQQWLSAMAVSNGCQQWLSAMAVLVAVCFPAKNGLFCGFWPKRTSPCEPARKNDSDGQISSSNGATFGKTALPAPGASGPRCPRPPASPAPGAPS